MSDPDWLSRLQRLRAIAQTGLAYSRDPYDLERFKEVESIALALLARLIDSTPAAVRDVYLPATGYPTPKIDVRAGVFDGDAVLLVREAADGRWTLPGGWGDENESPRASIEREVLEESGYRVSAERLVAVKDRQRHPYQPQRLESVYKLFFLCSLVGGSPRTSLETDAVGFFPLTELPPLSHGRTLVDDVVMLDRFRRDSSRPTQFD